MREKSNIAYGLLRRMAETAWEQGRPAEAQRMSAFVDAAMLERLTSGKGRQVSADEVPLIPAADGAERGSLAAGVDVAAVQAQPDGLATAGEQGVIL